jgi:regulator of RNase E activity RraA
MHAGHTRVAAMTIGVYVRCGHASSVRPIMMGVDFQVPVRIVTVVPGDTLMGEEHGVLVIPASIVDKVLEKAYSTTAERTSSVILF